jgi:hypothetical protein
MNIEPPSTSVAHAGGGIETAEPLLVVRGRHQHPLRIEGQATDADVVRRRRRILPSAGVVLLDAAVRQRAPDVAESTAPSGTAPRPDLPACGAGRRGSGSRCGPGAAGLPVRPARAGAASGAERRRGRGIRARSAARSAAAVSGHPGVGAPSARAGSASAAVMRPLSAGAAAVGRLLRRASCAGPAAPGPALEQATSSNSRILARTARHLTWSRWTGPLGCDRAFTSVSPPS